MTDLVSNQNYSVATGTNSTNPFVIHFDTRDPTTNDINYPLQKQWVNTALAKFWILTGFTTSNGVVSPNWVLFPSNSMASETLTGNSGGPVSADGSANINVIGDGTTITIAGNPGTNTLTAQLVGAVTSLFTADSGTATPLAGDIIIAGGSGVSTSAAGHTVTVATTTSVPTSFITDSGTATPSAHALHIVGDGASIATSGSGSTVTLTFTGASGVETLTGNSGGAIGPLANNINVVGDGSTVNVVGSGHTLTVSALGSVPIQFTGDSGTATPSAGNVNLFGTGSITTVASGHQVITELTGLTNHAVLVGNGTTTITKVGPSATALQVLQSQGSGADPAFSTATYPATTTVSQLLYSSSTNVVGGLATANRAVLTTGTTGIPVMTALATDGQVLIGSTAGVPAAATLTAGTGVTIGNASNAITISASGGGFTWNNITGTSSSLAASNGYQANNAGLVTLTLPVTSSFGDVIAICGYGAGGWRVAQNAGQSINMGLLSSTVGVTGHIDSNNQYDTVVLLCNVANTTWTRLSSEGNIGVT